MAVTKIKPIKSTLSKALDYIENPDKTDGKMLVSSFGCSYETADIEFEYTLSQALQKGNNLAFHLIQSFEPGEVDYQKAHEIGKQLADAVTKGQHEYVLTTHIRLDFPAHRRSWPAAAWCLSAGSNRHSQRTDYCSGCRYEDQGKRHR